MKDKGIGLDQQYGERIFQMFQRLHTREKYPGTGVGLAISKKIVERHGGRIWVESEEGRGATFIFTVPKVPGKDLETYDWSERRTNTTMIQDSGLDLM